MSRVESDVEATAVEKRIREFLDDPTAIVNVSRDDMGWLRVVVSTHRFQGVSEEQRFEMVQSALKPGGLSLNAFPIGGFRLNAHGERQEVDQPLPFWSDVLLAPDAEDQAPSPVDSPLTTPSTVAFYSFKGGVGRSTSLAFTANLLARENYRVVLVDLDLEAPGLSFFFRQDSQADHKGPGVLDYLYQRLLTPKASVPAITECTIPLDYRGPGRGEIILIPAGRFDETYVHKLADLSWRGLYRSTPNPVLTLLEDIKRELKPDAILIDARTGFADEGAVTLMGLADACVLCLSPTTQNLEGLAVVLRALGRSNASKRKPNVKFLLTPLASVPESIRKAWLDQFEDWVQEHWVVDKGQAVEDLFSAASYNPNILTLASFINGVPNELLEPYQPLAEFIATGLPEKDSLQTHTTSLGVERIHILDDLEKVSFPSAAQDIETEQLPELFQRTGDFPKFLRPTTWLTLGAKGTGKSVLFRLFVESSQQAVALAGVDALPAGLQFLAAHGKSTTSPVILSMADFLAFATQATKTGPVNWQGFWVAYLVFTLGYRLKDSLPDGLLPAEIAELLAKKTPTHTGIVDLIFKSTASHDGTTMMADTLAAIDSWLVTKGEQFWLFYDELDVAFEPTTRDIALTALLEWWLETGIRFKQLRPKILLRRDIWETVSFTNKAHYYSKLVILAWEEGDLWRLALRRTMRASTALTTVITGRYGASVDNLDNLSLSQLRDASSVLWGTRMGKTQKAYSYNWVRTRISDARGDAFPRSLGLLLETAIRREKEFSQPYSDDCLLRPRSLIDSIDIVSAQRVEEVKAEYPDLSGELNRLKDERSPIDADRLGVIWDLSEPALTEKIAVFVNAGIFENRSAKEKPDEKVYGVAELYLYGLGMKRKGQK